MPADKSTPIRLTPIKRAEVDPKSALLASLMDTAFVIPGTNIRFGFDAILDLIPGVGDAAGALVATAILGRASHLGVPKIVLARMAANVLLNATIGAIPILGAMMTIFFRSNAKNYELLRLHVGQPRSTTAGAWIFVIILILALLAALTLLAFGGIVLIKFLYRTIPTLF